MKIFLHIGTEKTGTTTVQDFLARNRGPLRKRGILFPTSLGETCQFKLAVYARQDAKVRDLMCFVGAGQGVDADQFREGIRSELRREISAASPDIVLLSNEHCSSRLMTEAHIAPLHDLLTELSDDVRIVVYLREQGDLLLSHYSTAVKSGAVATLKEFLARRIRLLDTAERAFYDYSLLLDNWARVFGKDRLAVRVFERASLCGGDVVQDFLEVVGVPADGLSHSPSANQRLNAYTTEFLRQLNRHVPYLVDNRRNEMRAGLHTSLENLTTGPTLTVKGLDAFVERFHESNTRVACDYLGRPDGVLFQSPKKVRDKSVTSQYITTQKAMEIGAKLWTRQQQEILSLRKELNELRKRRRVA